MAIGRLSMKVGKAGKAGLAGGARGRILGLNTGTRNGDVIANRPALEAKMIDAAARPVQPAVPIDEAERRLVSVLQEGQAGMGECYEY